MAAAVENSMLNTGRRSRRRNRRLLTLTLLSAAVVTAAIGCNDSDDPGTAPDRGGATKATSQASPVTDAQIEQLCSQCHLRPSPEILPRSDWAATISDMSKMRGFGEKLRPRPEVSDVIRWFQARAPESLERTEGLADQDLDPERFTPQAIDLPQRASRMVSSVRLLDVLDVAAGAELVVCDMQVGEVLLGRSDGAGGWQVAQIAEVPNPARVNAADVDGDGRTDLLVADLGSLLPLDHNLGQVVGLRQTEAGTFESSVLFDGLGRVAEVQGCDFDGDGDLDLVVAEFGWRDTGHVLVLENQTTDWNNPQFVKHIVDGRNGTVRVECLDLNGDGLDDFVALVSQGHEMLNVYLNRGGMRFLAQTLYRAPNPAWGYCTLDVADLDGDGDPDFLLGNGDTLDNAALKPHYGIAWLENQGEMTFEPHALLGMYGVMGVASGDLDGDGDLDLVAGAYVKAAAQRPDLRGLKLESLLWLEQTSPGEFRHRALEAERFVHLCLTLHDADGDGDADLFLGNATGERDEDTAAVEFWENRGASP